QRKVYWLNGWIVRVDDGETDESLADLYVTPTLPASKVEGAKGFIDQTLWDYTRSFAVEVECYPNRHWDRLESNYRRNKKMGFPTVFIVPNQTDEATLKEKLLQWNATLVANAAKFEQDHPEMATIEIVKTLNNQTDNPEPTTTTLQTIEPPPTPPTEILEQQEPIDVESNVLTLDDLHGKELLLMLASQDWWFRVRLSRGKEYLCARKGPKERCIGQFNKEMQKFVEENNITVKGDINKQET
ncbi:MAG: hypothetical protein LBI79_06725, partial [Nitrososphaerota archaeon]|nr:hypothetical protein [Nitrososphaerota archaeon]